MNRGQGGGDDDDDDHDPEANRSASNDSEDGENKDESLYRSLLHRHYSYDPTREQLDVSAETEAMTFFSTDASPSPLFCSGGGDNNEPDNKKTNITGQNGASDAASETSKTFVAIAECRFDGQESQTDYDEEDSDDESDDDDDGDDGANMMLSNASLRCGRRRHVASSGSQSSYTADHSSSSADVDGKRKRRFTPVSTFGAATRFCHQTISGSLGLRIRERRAGRFRQNNEVIPASSPALNVVSAVRGGAITAGSEYAKRLLVAALVTLMYEATIGHLFEFLKIVMQTSPPGTTYVDILKSITAEKGLAGIWDGFVPWGVVQSIFKGGVFGLAHAVALSYLRPLADKGVLPRQLALTLAGGIAGGFQGYVLSPTLLLKTRVMTDPIFRTSMSALRTTLLSFRIGLDVVGKEGVAALMKGSNIFATKRVFDWATRYYFSDVFSSLLLKFAASQDGLTPAERIAADLLGGTASTFVTLPLDVAVAKVQDAKKAGVKVSAWGLFHDELKEGGWSGLQKSYMRGFEARLLHVCCTTVAMKTGTALMYDTLFKK